MKYFIKKIYFIFFIINILLINNLAFSKNTNFYYNKNDVFNYFSGIISINQNNTTSGFKYLNKAKSLKNNHQNYNAKYLRSLVLLNKIDKAFSFSRDVWTEKKIFFDADLLIGLDYFLNKEYTKAEKHFSRLNEISRYNLIFDDFLGNILLSWSQASQNNKEEAFKYNNKIPNRYKGIKKIQNALLHCYYNSAKSENLFNELINYEEYNSSRYVFFLINYLIHNNKNKKAQVVTSDGRKEYSSNLLIKQSESYIKKNEYYKIKKMFDCRNPKDSIAEILYVIANLYSSNENYKLSNFYLNLSSFLNEKFIPNQTLLAENYFYLKQYNLSNKTYNSLKSVGNIYSWYASISSAIILENNFGKKEATSFLIKEFNKLQNPNFENYYEIANFFKDNENFEKSVEYYSLALDNIKKDHPLVPKILERRGTSLERLGEWERAEIDLLQSLQLLPDQPYVLNYLAYSWVDKKINISKSLEMLIKANELRKNDGYIIDSLGWAYYMDKNYIEAEKFLQRAVEIMPSDPIINDHYADVLWMLKKNMQARYFWKHVLSLKKAKKELKDEVEKKIIFGIM